MTCIPISFQFTIQCTNIISAIILSKTEININVHFPQVIHGNVPGLTHHVYFIRAGKCEIVKKVGFVRCVSPFLRPDLILQGSKSDKADPKKFLNKPYGRRLRRLTPEDHFLTVLTLTAGEYFGVGKYKYHGMWNTRKYCSAVNINFKITNQYYLMKLTIFFLSKTNMFIVLLFYLNLTSVT